MAKGHAKFTVKTPIVASKDWQAMGYQLIITRSGLQRAAMVATCHCDLVFCAEFITEFYCGEVISILAY